MAAASEHHRRREEVSNAGGYIGCFSGSTGTVTVDGILSAWSNSDYLYVGFVGARLNITNGGSVSNTYSSIGYFSGATGTVTVDGTGSTWSNSSGLCCVGDSGKGTLNITNGGSCSNASSYIGFIGSTGTVTVDGPGSAWTNSSELHIGDYGNGTLNITNGGSVSNTFGFIGFCSGSTGTVTVDGSRSIWTSNYLYIGPSDIGQSASGTLNITNGGSVSVTNDTYVAIGAGSTGTVNFGPSGGTLTTNTLYTSPTQLTGTGTINTKGLVGDFNLAFDASGTSSATFWRSGCGINGGYRRWQRHWWPRRGLCRHRHADNQERGQCLQCIWMPGYNGGSSGTAQWTVRDRSGAAAGSASAMGAAGR